MVIAVDFDGTLCKNAFPNIGELNYKLIDWCKEKQNQGNKLILWTCRNGQYLKEAIEACNSVGLFFDAINCNIDGRLEEYDWNDSRKVGADIYIDDKAYRPDEFTAIIENTK